MLEPSLQSWSCSPTKPRYGVRTAHLRTAERLYAGRHNRWSDMKGLTKSSD